MIPKTVHTVWVGSDPPSYLERHVRRWQHLHPGFAWVHWDERALRRFGLRHRGLFDGRDRFSPKSNDGQWKSNIARYEILYRLGGVYLDADMEPLQTVDGLESSSVLWAGWEQQGRHVNNAFLACPAGHPAMREILDGLEASVLAQPGRRSNRQTGGHYITPILRGRSDVTILDEAQVYPYGWRDVQDGHTKTYDGALMVHHWANKRREWGVPWPA